MKKFLLGAVVPLTLVACDRPFDRTELVCLDHLGQSSEYTQLGVMDVRFYDDYALVKIHGTEYKLTHDTNRRGTTPLYESYMYSADIPGVRDNFGIEYGIDTRTGFVNYMVWIGNSGMFCTKPRLASNS